jgi:adenine-specific DNA-methyltransferase
MSANGRTAYIIPSEFLNSDYGKLVKSYLLKSKTLRFIIVVDFENNVFDDALTTSSIILCANDSLSSEIQFKVINEIDELESVGRIIDAYPRNVNKDRSIPVSELNPNIKWKAYYQKQKADKYKYLVPFSKYGKVVRGIATGANDYFAFSQRKAQQYHIVQKYLLPCICKAVDVKKSIFTLDDFEDLAKNNKPTYLLNVTNPSDKYVQKYLDRGFELEINTRYLTASRNPWYALEKRPPSPIWVSVFNRSGLKFIRNEANISNLTTYHCIYPIESDLFPQIDINILFAYLLTDTAREIFEDNCREYGNGLQKFEPNDINKSMMLDLEKLEASPQKAIIHNYKMYRRSVITNQINDAYLSEINKIFTEAFSL